MHVSKPLDEVAAAFYHSLPPTKRRKQLEAMMLTALVASGASIGECLCSRVAHTFREAVERRREIDYAAVRTMFEQQKIVASVEDMWTTMCFPSHH